MAPWGWIEPARGMLILIAGVLGTALAWSSLGVPSGTIAPPSLVVDANTAPDPVLRALPGIGPVLAGRIVEARAASPFRSIDELDRRVRGIGPVKAAALRPYLWFGPPDRPSTPRP